MIVNSVWSCVISQRYPKLKAIHNKDNRKAEDVIVVLYHKDIQNWKQFTTLPVQKSSLAELCYITNISKIESNSQQNQSISLSNESCVISQRYPKLKAIHNAEFLMVLTLLVVLYHKDIQNWKQFTTKPHLWQEFEELCYITKISKIESNSQLYFKVLYKVYVVLYHKDIQNWKQFTTKITAKRKMS